MRFSPLFVLIFSWRTKEKRPGNAVDSWSFRVWFSLLTRAISWIKVMRIYHRKWNEILAQLTSIFMRIRRPVLDFWWSRIPNSCNLSGSLRQYFCARSIVLPDLFQSHEMGHCSLLPDPILRVLSAAHKGTSTLERVKILLVGDFVFFGKCSEKLLNSFLARPRFRWMYFFVTFFSFSLIPWTKIYIFLHWWRLSLQPAK